MGQNTQIRGFVEANIHLEDNKLNFGFGEQDLFITSQLNDHFSFLGESVFKFSPSSPTEFSVSVERVIVTYNYAGNHNILIGKHHTPINYWNDTYHHGRVFFPTVQRPLLFSAKIIPIHTTGIALQGLNLGNLRFGYNVMLGNGLGSEEITDNDKSKSLTVAVHIKPWNNWQIGTSFYNDAISAGAKAFGKTFQEKVNQQLYTASVAHFGKQYELLAEATVSSDRSNSTGRATAFAGYIYAGVRLNDQWVPYFRYDNLTFESNEPIFGMDDKTSFVLGVRYEISYLVVVKLEYQHLDSDASGKFDSLTTQIAIGF